MEVVYAPVSTKQRAPKGVIRSEDAAYNFKVSLYFIPPTEEFTMEECETYAISRLQVLKEIDTLKIRGVNGKEYDDRLRGLLNRNLPLVTPEDIRKDVLSHFILRFAFCRPADRKWFLSTETALLKFRLKDVDIPTLLKQHNLHYHPIQINELNSVEKELLEVESQFKYQPKMDPTAQYYKVPFEEALGLIKQRKVVVKKGWAYVNKEDFSSILIGRFRHNLSEALAVAAKVVGPLSEEFESIAPLLTQLSSQYVGSDYKPSGLKSTGKVELKDIDNLAKTSYPLCMRSLHQRLRETHHLKHMGRMQYGLFLKGIGLSLEDALMFWRNEFSRIHGIDGFEKHYAYNIRHNYGKEGRRTDYTPYSCLKIINGTVSAGEHHGCPFKHFDEERLKYNLQSQGVAASGITEIIQLVKGQHYQIACKRHFELTHPGSNKTDLIINHPNQYFDESQKYHRGVNGTADAPKVKPEDKMQM